MDILPPNNKKSPKPKFGEYHGSRWLDDYKEIKNQVKKESSKDAESKHSKFRWQRINFGFLNTALNWVKTKSKLVKSLSRRQALAVGGVVIATVAALFVFLPDKKQDSSYSQNVQGQSTGGVELPREQPKFQILYPGNKNKDTIGEIVKVSPKGSEPAYTYIDNIANVQINVTQQQMPDKFKVNTDAELEKLADSFQQKSVIKIDSIKVFHGQSASGVQSLVFIKGNLLITIRAAQELSDDTWAAYISALHS